MIKASNVSKIYLLLGLVIMLSLASCLNKGDTLADSEMGLPGSAEGNEEQDDSLGSAKFLKVIYTANENAYGNEALLIGGSTTMRAALFDLAGNFLELAPATWAVSSGFTASDVVPSGDGLSATFTPTNIGTARVSAVYAGVDSSVISTNDSTGTITVTHIQVPNTIVINGGDGQTGVVNTILSSNLSVVVRDTFNLPIAGVQVSFSVTTGNGSIIGTNPVTTNASGIASVQVRLGTVADASSNTYRAVVDSDPSIYTDFTAIANPGPPAQLAFTTSPGLSYAGVPFGSQPIVAVRDQYGNPLTISSGTVSLSVASGAGNLTGTTTVSFTNGSAAFTGVAFDSADTGVSLQATSGAMNTTSSTFNVLGAPPGACINEEPGYFLTGAGGCQDQTTGLVWAQGSAVTMSYYDAVWDESLPGASNSDEFDYGRTNDYGEEGCNAGLSYYCDNNAFVNPAGFEPSTTSYCHDLIQGGYEDWRFPSMNELTSAVNTSLSGSSGPHVRYGSSASYHWVATHFNFERSYVVVPSSGAMTYTGRNALQRVICVRGGWSDPSQITAASTLTEISIGVLPTSAITVQLEQATGKKINAQGITINLISASNGTLGGTLSVQTNNRGIATFNAFTINNGTYGPTTLTFSAAGLGTATFDVNLRFKQKCKVEDGNFINADGGCKQVGSNLVWSTVGSSVTPWGTVVHSSEITGTQGTADDNLAVNYCYDLVESSYSDWRTPTFTEVQAAVGMGIYSTYFDVLGAAGYLWTSTSNALNEAMIVNIATGGPLSRVIGNSYTPICVRDP